jgi:antitoxin CptB
MNLISKQQLRWKCRRGMLELDVILNRFLENKFDALEDANKKIFIELLDEADPDLYSWFLGYAMPLQKDFLPIIALIRGT